MALNTGNLKYLSHNSSRPVDWSTLDPDGDLDYDTYSYAETFDFEDTGDDGTGGTRTVVYVRGLGPIAVVVDGRSITTGDIDQMYADLDDDNREAEEARLVEWRGIIDRSSDSTYMAEGPMMSWYWPIEDDADSFDETRLARMATSIASLPLCVVWLDGTIGVALTGGGMDLSWQIAEAFIRLGWYPPSSLTLPSYDYSTAEIRAEILLALHTSKAVHAAQLAHQAQDLLKLMPEPGKV